MSSLALSIKSKRGKDKGSFYNKNSYPTISWFNDIIEEVMRNMKEYLSRSNISQKDTLIELMELESFYRPKRS
jgi:peptide methionine sulfoxide reductase MsrA